MPTQRQFRSCSNLLVLESRVGMQKRGQANPDDGDALALTFAQAVVPAKSTTAKTKRYSAGLRTSRFEGDGYRGWLEEAPFDHVILTASPREVPQTLIDQLARGGRLVAPVGRLGGQELVLIEKKADGTLRRRSVGPVAIVPMKPGLLAFKAPLFGIANFILGLRPVVRVHARFIAPQDIEFVTYAAEIPAPSNAAVATRPSHTDGTSQK
jgi:hypothetical protein